MSDRYNNKLAFLIGYLNGSDGKGYAVTVSAATTLYSCDKQTVLDDPQWMIHERYHRLSIADRQKRKGKILGWLDWFVTYGWRLLTKGYKNSEEEIAAREFALWNL